MASRSFLSLCRRRSLQLRSLSSSSNTSNTHFDVLIVGGGVVGSALARCLNQELPALRVGLVEQSKGPPLLKQADNKIPHPRAYALSPKSLEILGDDICSSVPQGTYTSMQVWEQDSPSSIVFTTDDISSSKEDSSVRQLGAVVEDTPLVQALWDELRGSSSTTLLPETQLTQAQLVDDDKKVQVTTVPSSRSKDDDDDPKNTSTTLTTSLLVAADGGNSWVRRHFAMPYEGFQYDRTAVTCTVQLATEMPPRAFQRFLPNGPLALLPTFDKNYATIVWSTTPEEADDLQLKDDELVQRVNEVLQVGPQRMPSLLSHHHPTMLGNLAYGVNKVVETLQYGLTMAHWNDYDETFVAPPLVKATSSQIFKFPLACRQAPTYVHESQRVVLVGDAAHTVHPMAGQGLNLGLGDVKTLVDSLATATHSGMPLHTFLSSHYGIPQQFQNKIYIEGIHALHQVFGQRSVPWMHSKSLGMHAVNHITPIRTQLANVATGRV